VKKKTFWIPTIASILTTSVLYLCGHLYNIESLRWFNFTETSNGGFTFGGSLNPIIFGFVAGFIAEWIYKSRKKNRTDLV
jgi:membrane protease YdiL (CAAX protease family)